MPIKNIQNLQELNQSIVKPIKLIIHSAAGEGKTHFMCSAGKKYKCILIDCDFGASWIPEEFAKKIDIVQPKSPSELEEVLDSPDLIKDYDVLIIDSLTSLVSLITDTFKKDKESLTLNEWGQTTSILERILRKCQALPIHFLASALSREIQDDDAILRRPMITPKTAINACGMVDLVLFLENTKDKRLAYTQPKNSKIYCKNRCGHLPDILEDEQIDFCWIVDQLLSERPEATDEQKKSIRNMFKELNFDTATKEKAYAYVGFGEGDKFYKHQYLKLSEVLQSKLKLQERNNEEALEVTEDLKVKEQVKNIEKVTEPKVKK